MHEHFFGGHLNLVKTIKQLMQVEQGPWCTVDYIFPASKDLYCFSAAVE